jgi:hypothetical protein
MPLITIARTAVDCDTGLSTELMRFDVPPSVWRDRDEHAAARYIDGVVHISDATEWFRVPESVGVPVTGWWHHSGIDFQTVKGLI